MILRRLTKHIKDQNWFAVGLDFVIVVVGILIAFQITNWNENRAERTQEVRYLSSMKRDVESSIRILNDSIANLQRQQNARQALYTFHADPAAVMESDELDKLIADGLFSLERANLNQTTFETLKSSGQMSMIKSSELVKALQDLNAKIDMAEVDKNEDFQFTFRIVDPLLIGEGDFDNILMLDLSSIHNRLPWVIKQPGAGYSSDLVRSQRFKNIMLYKALYGQLRLEGFRSILEQHKLILSLIDERQVKLGVTP
tara:strand:+ start:413 stop:1180 length:768 start_codon:yes stop_codon:yes gene_type:complete